jgi:NAD(P)-dependent dehydrogenase (short-subunit alcohol dehydrogenase family)
MHDGDETMDRFAKELRGRAFDLIEVLPTEAGRRPGRTRLIAEPASAADMALVIERITPNDNAPLILLYAWGQDWPAERSIAALMSLGRQLALARSEAVIDLVLLVRNAHDVLGQEQVFPDRAVLGPLARVLANECPRIRAWEFDIGDNESDDWMAAIPERMSAEKNIAPFAWRRRRWLTRELQPASVPSKNGIAFKTRGVYLIVGGSGGLGLEFARELARRWQARLVLVSRTLGGKATSFGATVAEMEALGAEVLALAADVTDEAQMRAVIGEARLRFGMIDGVIHAAGIPGGGVLALKDWTTAASVIAPKIAGARVLARALNDDRPRFIAFCSSIASLTSDFGQSDYAAANGFLDAFAWRLRLEGWTALAINWGAWSQVGMAARTDVPSEAAAARLRMLTGGIDPEEGCRALADALALGETQVVVAPVNLLRWIEAARRGIQNQTNANSAPVESLTRRKQPRPDLTNPFTPAATPLEETLVEVWEDLLGISGVGVEDNFFHLGGNSLIAIQLIPRIKARTTLPISTATLFEGQNIRALARTMERSTASVAAISQRAERIRAAQRKVVER